MNRWALAALVAGGVLVVDQVTKAWAEATLPGNPLVVIDGWLAFQYAENPGAAFGILQGAGPFLAIAAVVAIGIVAFMIRAAERTGEVVGLAAIAGGAAGNLVDRLTRGEGLADGAVVDFIRIPVIPNFNVADASLTVGVGLLLVLAFTRERDAV